MTFLEIFGLVSTVVLTAAGLVMLYGLRYQRKYIVQQRKIIEANRRQFIIGDEYMRALFNQENRIIKHIVEKEPLMLSDINPILKETGKTIIALNELNSYMREEIDVALEKLKKL